MLRPFLLTSVFVLALVSSSLRAADENPPSSNGAPKTSSVAEQVKQIVKRASALQGTDPKGALDLARQALKLARREQDRPAELAALHKVASVLMRLGNFREGQSVGEEALALAVSLGDLPEQGEFHLLLSNVLWARGDMPGAAAEGTEFLHVGEALGDKSIQQRAEETLGVIYATNEDYPSARRHLEAALRFAEDINSPHLARTLINLGDTCLREKDYGNARTYLEHALAPARGEKDPTVLAPLLYSLGEVLSIQGDQVQAAKYLDESLAIAQGSQDNITTAHVHRVYAGVERRLNRLDSAWGHLQQSLGLVEKVKDSDLLTQLYEEVVQTSKARNDYHSAYEYTGKLAELNATVRNEKSRLKAAEIEGRYEVQARAREIKLLQGERDLQQSQLTLQKTELTRVHTQRYAIIAVLGCLGVAVAAVAERQRLRARATQQMLVETRAAKETVEAADARKGLLLAAATKDLHESEARFRSAFEHSAIGIALLTPEGRWLRVNHALCKLLGYDEPAMLETTARSLTHPDDWPGTERLVSQLTRGEIESYQLEKRFIHRNGHTVWALVDASAVRETEGSQPLYLISQIQDITERKMANELLRAAKDEAEQASSAKSDFLSRVSHELRTPLNAILGFGQLLELEQIEARATESVEHIMKAGRHLLELIDELLDLSQIESGQLQFTCEAVSIRDVVAETVDLMRPAADQLGVKLRVEVGGVGEGMAKGDLRRLRQVLLNLLSNAVKYNQAGGEAVVSCRTTDDDRLCIEVRDTGPGIAAEDLERIFAPFVRLAATNKVQGTGLGLSHSKKLVEAMGGTLGVQSQLGEGSVFRVELERATGTPDTFRDQPQPTPVPLWQAIDHGEITALYIEDNMDNVQLVEHVLGRRRGLHLLTAMQGQQGLDMARQHCPDVILLDLNLPDMHGTEVLATLSALPETALTPVIVISADATLNHLEALRSHGMREYLKKPFDVHDLNRAIDDALSTNPAMAGMS